MIETINEIREELPPGWVIALLIEKGAGWVELADPDGENIELPDPINETITEQLDSALCTAKNFHETSIKVRTEL